MAKPASAQNARSNGSIKTEISHLENRWLKAIETADVPALNAILADDFVRPAPTTGRFVTKSELVAYYNSHKPTASAASHIENSR